MNGTGDDLYTFECTCEDDDITPSCVSLQYEEHLIRIFSLRADNENGKQSSLFTIHCTTHKYNCRTSSVDETYVVVEKKKRKKNYTSRKYAIKRIDENKKCQLTFMSKFQALLTLSCPN